MSCKKLLFWLLLTSVPALPVLSQESDTDSLIYKLSEVIRLSPKNDKYLAQRGKLYMLRGDDFRAIADFEDAILHNADNTDALFFRAYLYQRQRLYKKARVDYEHLISLQPRHRDARMGLVLLNDADNRPVEAMEQMDVLMRYWPDDPEILVLRGGMYHKRREYEKALKDINKAIEFSPLNPDFYISRALLYKDFNKTILAQEDIRRAVSLGANKQDCANLMLESKNKKGKKK